MDNTGGVDIFQAALRGTSANDCRPKIGYAAYENLVEKVLDELLLEWS